ncbi:MAG TPA: hypothetical protein VFV99_01940 [Kofleriaceae bacterium]|nr:hypothetical protein [Kofleriaceae bacterium]
MARAETEGEPTTTIERDALRDLLDLTVEPPSAQPAHPAQHAHTVPRGQVRHRDDADDLDPQLSPLVVIGVLGLLLVVFIAVSQLH